MISLLLFGWGFRVGGCFFFSISWLCLGRLVVGLFGFSILALVLVGAGELVNRWKGSIGFRNEVGDKIT